MKKETYLLYNLVGICRLLNSLILTCFLTGNFLQKSNKKTFTSETRENGRGLEMTMKRKGADIYQ